MEKLSSLSEEVLNQNNIFLDMGRLVAVLEEGRLPPVTPLGDVVRKSGNDHAG